MTKEELIAKLKELGLSGIDGLKDEALEKLKKYLDEQKAQLDTETRRKVRAFWIGVTARGHCPRHRCRLVWALHDRVTPCTRFYR